MTKLDFIEIVSVKGESDIFFNKLFQSCLQGRTFKICPFRCKCMGRSGRGKIRRGTCASWVLAMGSILLHENGDDVYQLSGRYRSSNEVERCRNLLSDSWGSPNRESLLRQIKALLSYGHNSAFKHDYSIASALSQEDFDALLEQSNDLDRYMWRQVKQLGDKWGDTGIIAWDLMRVSHLVQWGYRSGYLTYAEAHALVEPAAKQLQQRFTSWGEAMENYLDGYAYWGRIDMTLADTKYQSRKAIYEQLKAEQVQNGILYDDALWNAPLIPVPNINAESLLEGF